jgi:hypothetical protein
MFGIVFSDKKDLLSTSLYISFQASTNFSPYGTVTVLSTQYANILPVCVKLAITCNSNRPVQQQQASLLSFINLFIRKKYWRNSSFHVTVDLKKPAADGTQSYSEPQS